MNLIITTKEELEDLVKTSVRNGIKEYFLEQELKDSKDPYITVQEAEVRVKVSNLTVRNYIKRYLIKARKVGNRILLDTKSDDLIARKHLLFGDIQKIKEGFEKPYQIVIDNRNGKAELFSKMPIQLKD